MLLRMILQAMLVLMLTIQIHGDDQFIMVTKGLYAAQQHIRSIAQQLGTEIVDTPRDVETPELCQACLFVMDTFNTAVKAYLSWSDIEPMATQICSQLLIQIGFDPQLLCPRLGKLYGPKILEIFYERPNESMVYCIELNLCDIGVPLEAYIPNIRIRSESDNVTPDVETHKSDIIKVAQLTDVHIDHKYREGTPMTECKAFLCCRDEYGGTGSAGKYGEYQCNIPVRTMKLFLEKVDALNPDFIVHTGDNPPNYIWEETKELMQNTTREVAALYRSQFGGRKRVFPSIGNHEVFPSNMYYLKDNATQEFNQLYAEVWEDLAGFRAGQRRTISQSGCYTVFINSRLRIVSYNSVFGYTQDFYNILHSAIQDFENMMDWLWRTLDRARLGREKVIMLGHHPLGDIDTGVRFAKSMTALCTEFKDTIVLHVIGHEHADDFQLVSNSHVVFTAPSLTTYLYVNPSMRIYYLNATTYELLDYEQYHLDLKSITDDEEPEIKLAYRFTEEYPTYNLTPASMLKLASSIRDDQLVQAKFLNNRNGRTGGEALCTGVCRLEHICRLFHSDWLAIQQCLKTVGEKTIQTMAMHDTSYG